MSTATKNKLSAFQFGAHSTNKNAIKPVTSLLADADKENEGATRRRRRTPPDAGIPRNALEMSHDPPALPARKSVPSTPVGRLALPDLLGMGDVRRPAQSVSPDERIEWDHKGKGYDSACGGIRRAKKRARSSSPTRSSPARVFGSHPQVDPGSELWGRYSLNASHAPTPQGPCVPNLALIMHTSSPQSKEDRTTPRAGGGFRRANSCGNQFPKRRRTGGCDREDTSAESAAVGRSKLSVLIERVAEGLSQAPKQIAADRLSRDSSEASRSRQLSPDNADLLTSPGHCLESEDLSMKGDRNSAPKENEETSLPPLPETDDTDYDEFDDDELDAGLLEIVDAHDEGSRLPFDPPSPQQRSVAARVPPHAAPPRCIPKHEPIVARAPVSEMQLPRVPQPRRIKPVKAEKDEFDDSDDEMFIEAASQFDPPVQVEDRTSRVANLGVKNARPLRRVPPKAAESDDEFGDGGLDDSDFEEAELSATQAIQQTGNGLLPVRAKY